MINQPRVQQSVLWFFTDLHHARWTCTDTSYKPVQAHQPAVHLRAYMRLTCEPRTRPPAALEYARIHHMQASLVFSTWAASQRRRRTSQFLALLQIERALLWCFIIVSKFISNPFSNVCFILSEHWLIRQGHKLLHANQRLQWQEGANCTKDFS